MFGNKEIRIGCWERRSKSSGNVYYNGRSTIDGCDYWINVVENQYHKENPKAPHINIIMTPVIQNCDENGTQPSTDGEDTNDSQLNNSGEKYPF